MVSGRHEVVERVVQSGVVAVLRGVDADAVTDIAEALREGGVTAIELTADTSGFLELIEEVSASFSGSETLVGAGTVLDSETARAAQLAGADFVVTPTVELDVLEVCNRYGVPVAPGAMTPTEVLRAYEAGADLVKLFPASTLGPGHLRSVKGPLGQVPLMPTGGVTLDNVADFIEAGAACVGVGGALVDESAVAAGEFDRLTETARAFTDAVETARG